MPSCIDTRASRRAPSPNVTALIATAASSNAAPTPRLLNISRLAGHTASAFDRSAGFSSLSITRVAMP
jgi:hypothetical protein